LHDWTTGRQERTGKSEVSFALCNVLVLSASCRWWSEPDMGVLSLFATVWLHERHTGEGWERKKICVCEWLTRRVGGSGS
jgi:hypothetical protein